MCDEQQRRARARALRSPHITLAAQVAQRHNPGVFLAAVAAHRDRLTRDLAAQETPPSTPPPPCGCNESARRRATAHPALTTPNPTPNPTPNGDTRSDPNAFPDPIHLTDESLNNVQKTPPGTRFYCMISPQGDAHCAASKGPTPLPPSAHSHLNGQPVAPLEPNGLGTGHQQVARAVGIPFDEQSARVGYVEGEGFGFSLQKNDDCDRAYTFESAFNEKLGDRTLPQPLSDQLHQQVEAAFPPCPVPPHPLP
jgi:hypothetical protein